VNLILGGQNSGKTSLLEAVYLGKEGSSEGRDCFRLARDLIFRKNSDMRMNEWLVYAGSKLGISIQVQGEKPNFVGCFSVYPIEEAALVKLYDIAVRNKTKKQLINLLKKIESRLENLESISAYGEEQPTIHAELTAISKLMPLSQLGQGFNRLAYLYAGLLGQNANIALIDEIENGIHYSALPILWQGIANIARELDIQIFATTHSKECIRAASDAFKDSPDDFQVIRLVRKDDNIEAQIIPADYVEATLEMRGELR
jgi:AAA15 family ATPase/GTPase